MLTKDLLKCRMRAGRVIPQFVPSDEAEFLTIAKDLVDGVSARCGSSRKDLDEFLAESFDASHAAVPGLIKISLDQCEWAEDDGAIADQRWHWLRQAQDLRNRMSFDSIETYQTGVASHIDCQFSKISDELFRDLPENKLMEKSVDLKPVELLHRYNLALVQGLLFHANSMRLELDDLTLVEKRSLFRKLKFHQLMAKVSSEKKGARLILEIDGPMNLFDKSTIYGKKFANFFPYIPLFAKWKLSAQTEWKKKSVELRISNKDSLVSHYDSGSGYIPEEYSGFEKAFNQSFGDDEASWKVQVGGDFVDIGQESYCFPDFEFIGKTAEKVGFELFHKWHKGQLIKRLQSLEENGSKSLILGVCRKVAKQKEIKSVLDNSKWFQKNGLLFSDFPTTSAVKKMLLSRCGDR